MNSASESRLNRIHLVVTIITSLIAAALGVFGFVNQNKAQDRGDQIQDLGGELESLEAERDGLQAVTEEQSSTIGELENTIAELTGGEVPPPTSDAYLQLDENVGVIDCSVAYSSGEWSGEGIELGGNKYWNGFSCLPYRNNSNEYPTGHIDFLVPESTERLTGTIGIDDRSADTTMVAEFSVLSVPEGEGPLFSEVITFGDITEIDVDVQGLNRVRLEIRVQETDYFYSVTLEDGAGLSWADMKFE